MLCEVCWCIYNENKKCILKSIEIDSLGMCSQCILPNFSGEAIEKAKSELLEKYCDII